jgi:SAM-dependent methyltransferase
MDPSGLAKMFRENRMQDNPPGDFRPNEALIEAVASRLMPGGRALDLSNDDGINALYLAQSGYAVALVGIYPGEVELARQRVEEARAKVEVYSAEPTKMPFHSGEFDIVFDPRLIDSLKGEEKELFIREVHRMLRPGGILILLMPNYKDTATRGCVTQQSVEELFHPLFEVMRVVDTGTVDAAGGLRYNYSAWLRKR